MTMWNYSREFLSVSTTRLCTSSFSHTRFYTSHSAPTLVTYSVDDSDYVNSNGTDLRKIILIFRDFQSWKLIFRTGVVQPLKIVITPYLFCCESGRPWLHFLKGWEDKISRYSLHVSRPSISLSLSGYVNKPFPYLQSEVFATSNHTFSTCRLTSKGMSRTILTTIFRL